MIKNEKQYRVTKNQAEKFAQTLEQLKVSTEFMHPILLKARIDAITSQLDELYFQIAEYEALASGKISKLEFHSFDEISDALIKARIASGMTQKALAEKLGLKEQQIQRYEADGYKTASIERVSQVIDALGITMKEEFFLPSASISFKRLFNQLSASGIDSDFVIKRILPSDIVDKVQEKSEETKSLALRIASVISRIFPWAVEDLFGNAPLNLATSLPGITRFKVTGRTDTKFLGFYTLYARYIAELVLKASRDLTIKPVPTDPSLVRAEILQAYQTVNFENILRYVWSLGIPVIPLDDPGAFHGACWREQGRNIIVLKQQTASLSRWSFDLLHEFRHAGESPQEETFALIEPPETSSERIESEEEQEASMFAGNVLLDNQAENLAQKAIFKANQRIPLLKSVVRDVAQEANVSPSDLANYLAFRLSLQGENWWGAATNLQDMGNPAEIARNILFEKINLRYLTSSEQELLLRAMATY